MPADRSCPEGGLVLDPFAGTGATLVAAQLLGRRAVGADLEERYCEAAPRRLEQAQREGLGEAA
ncbi:DNA methyltransferase [Myxococcus sp. Y35]|uniref:DNA methyltransferase n=1 Tax=Pseudomyxococcus flavus TaxID=3115648 RepID=UPI003CE6FB7D